MRQRLVFGLILFVPMVALTGCGGGFGGSIKSEVKTAADFLARKDDAKAKALLDPVLASDPKDPRANYYSALIDEHARKYKDALEKLNVAIDSDPGYAEAYSERALVQTRLGDNDAALADANQSTRLAPDVALNHLRRALVALNSKEWQLALDSLDAVAKLDGQKSAYWIAAYRAEAYLGMKDLQRAREYFDDAARAGGKAQPVVYLRRAICLARLGDFAGARKDCAHFLAARPGDASAHALMGALMCLNGDAAGARREYIHSVGHATAGDLADTVDLGADDSLAVTELVDIYLEKKDPETAAAILTRVESHRPLEPTEQYRLALCNFALDRPERAITLLNSCISMSPEYIAPRVELIHYYASTGLPAKALELQREAYAIAHNAKDKSEIAGAMLRRK